MTPQRRPVGPIEALAVMFYVGARAELVAASAGVEGFYAEVRAVMLDELAMCGSAFILLSLIEHPAREHKIAAINLSNRYGRMTRTQDIRPTYQQWHDALERSRRIVEAYREENEEKDPLV